MKASDIPRGRPRHGRAPTSLLACCIAVVLAAGIPAAAAAAPPANDQRDAATAVTLPGKVAGTTTEATLQADEPPDIGGARLAGTVWYQFSTAQSRRVAIRVSAAGDLDAAVEVFRRARSQFIPEQQALTDEGGKALIFVDAREGRQYFVRIGQRDNSVAGSFSVEFLLPALAPPGPGGQLPRGGATASVDPLANTADAWSTVLHAGVTYRVHIVTLAGRPLQLGMFAPGTRSFLAAAPMRTSRSYFLFTPGADEGGRYSFLVSSTATLGSQRYRLQVGPARADDMWPGRVLPNFRATRSAFDDDGMDVVDTYRFDVVDRSAVTLTVRTAERNAYTLRLLRAGGHRVAAVSSAGGPSELKRTLPPGRYVVVVRARGRATGAYVLRRAARTLTHLAMSGPLSEPVAPGAPVTLHLQLDPGGSGPATVTIERFDPYTGWHFARRMETRIVAGAGAVTFQPGVVGRWRARATFDGTRTTETSATRGDTEFLVAGPLEP